MRVTPAVPAVLPPARLPTPALLAALLAVSPLAYQKGRSDLLLVLPPDRLLTPGVLAVQAVATAMRVTPVVLVAKVWAVPMAGGDP
jgi:hypothetical protein